MQKTDGTSAPHGYFSQENVYEAQSQVLTQKALHASITQAYGEMTAGLLITAVVAAVANYFNLFGYLSMSTFGVIISWVLIFAPFGFIFFINPSRIFRMEPAKARAIFYAFAFVMGLSLSTIFTRYSFGNIAIALLISAGLFFCLTMIALTTKKDLLKAGPVLFAALIVLIVAEVILFLVGMFTGIPQGATMILSLFGIIIFAGFTAYDAQRIRAMYQQYGTSPVMIKRLSILAALSLYLDFLNLFLFILNIFGAGSRR